MKRVFKIKVDCANCANKMEMCANKVEGVKSAFINFMMLKMTVEFEDGYSVNDVMTNVLKECKKIERDCEIFF